MTQETVFIRLIDVPVEDKGAALQFHVGTVNGDAEPDNGMAGAECGNHFLVDPDDFSKIPKSPFSYWISTTIRHLFVQMTSLEERGFLAQHGASTKNDPRFLRLWWEVAPDTIGQRAEDTYLAAYWVPFAKGGEYSPYYADVHLVINWKNEAEAIEKYVTDRYPYLKGNAAWILHPENNYFSSGLTWTLRTQLGLNFRVLPSGCVFGSKGPALFVPTSSTQDLLNLLSIVNSSVFRLLVELQMAFGSYEVGTIRRTPIPSVDCQESSEQTRRAYTIQRDQDRVDETTHAFCLPVMLSGHHETLSGCQITSEQHRQRQHENLRSIEVAIDDAIRRSYQLSSDDWRLVSTEVDDLIRPANKGAISDQVEDLLMWCVGVTFGRWDVRKALDSLLLPPPGEPFDPLPRCAPGALMGEDGLPLSREHLSADYPLPIAWDGILVDDPTHPSDIVSRVRGVLHLLWGERSGEIEVEACEILKVETLRDYFRDPRKFFAFHIKRYSKSRRRAPIYWLLQSEHRSYGIWLYYHRLNASTLYTAGREYADVKVNLEQDHLTRRKEGLASLEGADLRRRQRQIAHQERVLAEVTAFRNTLDKIALQDLVPDVNDGVVISIAPLHDLVPWTYAERTWKELVRGDHDWSTMAKQMRAKGLVRSKNR